MELLRGVVGRPCLASLQSLISTLVLSYIRVMTSDSKFRSVQLWGHHLVQIYSLLGHSLRFELKAEGMSLGCGTPRLAELSGLSPSQQFRLLMLLYGQIQAQLGVHHIPAGLRLQW